MDSGLQLGVMLDCVDLDVLERKAAHAEAAGYTACQVSVRWEITPGEAVCAEEICRKRGLDVVAYGAYIHLLRPDDETFHGVAIPAVYNLIEAMRETRCRRIVVWSGTHGRRLGEGHPDNWTAATHEAAVAQARDLATRLRMYDGLLCLEPYYMHVLRTPEEYAAFAHEVDPDVVRVVLDPPNFVPPDDYDRFPELLPQNVAPRAPVVGLVHLKDFTRAADGSLRMPGPGQGSVDYAAFIGALRENGVTAPAIIEHIDSDSVPDMLRAREYVERFL